LKKEKKQFAVGSPTTGWLIKLMIFFVPRIRQKRNRWIEDGVSNVGTLSSLTISQIRGSGGFGDGLSYLP
jgi:hypothetical protein